jgi:predicted Zn finger-like uncharacterized protein
VNVPCPECRSVFRVDPAKVPPTTVRARCSVCGGVITVNTGSSIEDEFSSNSPTTARSARPSDAARTMGAPHGNAGLSTALMDAIAPAPMIGRAPMPASNATPLAPAERSRPVAAEALTASKPIPQAPAPVGAKPSASPSVQPSNSRPVLFPPRPMIPPAGSGSGAAPSRPLMAPRPPASAPAVALSSPQPSPAPPLASSAPSLSPAPAVRPNTSPVTTGAKPTSPAPITGAPTAARTPINPFLANDPNAKAKRLARALISDLVTYFPQKRQDGLRDGTLKQLFKDEIQKSYEEYVAQVGREFAESTPHFQEALNDLLAGGQKVF